MTPVWITISQNTAVGSSGERRSMKTPRFQTAIPPTKYTNRRFSRLPELRRSAIPARETLRISATSGRKLCSVTRVPLQEVNVEQARDPERRGPFGLGIDDEHDLGRIHEARLVERGVLVVDVLVGVQELAADHALEERIFRPAREILEVLGAQGPQIDARAPRDHTRAARSSRVGPP